METNATRVDVPATDLVPIGMHSQPIVDAAVPARISFSHKSKLIAHSEECFGGLTRQTEPLETARRLRAFVRLEEQRLRYAHQLGATGLWTATARSLVFDVLVTGVFKLALKWTRGLDADLAQAGFSVIALGGYGRSELAPYSDLDLLLLETGRDAHAREIFETALQMLWDIGLTIGHRQHRLNECVLAARSDPHLLTALVTMRRIAGSQQLYDKLSEAVARETNSRRKAYMAALQSEFEARRLKFGSTVCLQEPNVKESAGALRDLHLGLWSIFSHSGARTLADIREKQLLPPETVDKVERAFDFLMRVRHEAHWLAGRKNDRIPLELQEAMAAKFGYGASQHMRPSELFMRDYYKHATELQRFGEAQLARAQEGLEKRPRWLARYRRERIDGLFQISEGLLQYATDGPSLAQKPLMMLKAVELAQTAGVGLSQQLREAIGNSLDAIDRPFRQSAEVANMFMNLLRRKGRVGRALRMLHETGFLGRYLPEFGRISLLIQHDLYHHYTIDEHSLRAIDALDHVVESSESSPNEISATCAKIEDFATLYLAVLLHDIGKGKGKGHVERGTRIAAKITKRMQLPEQQATQVVALCEHHILMSHISQRRDLKDASVVASFAASVGSADILDMLLLLTRADLEAVGPGVWSEWKGSLLVDLYQQTSALLSGHNTDDIVQRLYAARVAEVADLLEEKFETTHIARHLELLPHRYVRAYGAAEIAVHIELVEWLNKADFACSWEQISSGATALTICTRDRHGLFADLAGTLTAQGTEILSADVNTRSDAVVLDSFVLRESSTHTAVSPHKRTGIERTLKATIASENDVAGLIERWKTKNAPRRNKAQQALRKRMASEPIVKCDNQITPAATLLEVRAHDEPGLAFKIAHVIAACGFDISFAKIATEKSDALDVFYVTRDVNTKLTESEVGILTHALVERLKKNG